MTGLNFWKVNHRSPTVDISVEFHTGYHGDRYIFDGNGGKLAHAFYPNKKLGMLLIFLFNGKNLISQMIHYVKIANPLTR